MASVVPGMTWREIAGDLPLAVGLQLRNIALAEGGVKVIPHGGNEDKAIAEIFDNPDDLAEFLGESE